MSVLAAMTGCQRQDDSALASVRAELEQLAADVKRLDKMVTTASRPNEPAVQPAVAQVKDESAKSAAEPTKMAEELAQVKKELGEMKTQWNEMREKWEASTEELVKLRKAVSLLVVSGGQPSAEGSQPRLTGPRRILPPPIDAVAAGKKAIELYDENKDGKLSGAELDKCPGLKAALARVDPSGAGEVTAAMITKRIQAWQASHLGRMAFACWVTRNGQPLKDAVVTFVPEKFLGDQMQTATGMTSEPGRAMISVPVSGSEPQGLPPGFYRVEITKPGDSIPAKYNSETIFGQEVAIDVGMMQPPTFDLEY
ncbi:MAG: hypothetical protein ABFC96_10265 [Thermoguttaceae bacterium]